MPDPSVAPFTYRAFISYSHRDKAWADWLHKALETYRVPSRLVGTETARGKIPRRLNPVFRDREELSSAPELGSKINEALARSENLVVICSPASAASRWVNEEVLAYKRVGRAARIFCLIVDGEPNATDMPGRGVEECFCPALRFATDSDGRPTNERTEPIAADARAGKDGKPNAKLKLIAGMLDVGFDALKQRELQRRNRRMSAITALAVTVMVITGALALFAVRAERKAEQERDRAVRAEHLAQHERSQAEGLIGFMLGDLHTKLEAVNRLDILNAVAQKAMGYFSSLDESEVTDESLAQRSQALQLIGRVREEQGKLPQALASFDESLRLMQQLVARNPHNAKWKMALAESYLWIGYVAWDRNDLHLALREFQLAAPLARSVVHDHPGNADWAKQLSWVTNDIGHVLQASGQLQSAEREYREVLRMRAGLAAKDPSIRRYQSELAHAYDNLAENDFAAAALHDAVTNSSEALKIWQTLAAQDSKDMSVQMYLARTSADLAKEFWALGQRKQAQAALAKSLDIGLRLLKNDSDAKDVVEHVAAYDSAMARMLRVEGDFARAGSLLEASAAMYAQLIHKEPDVPAWQADLAKNRLESARMDWKKHDLAGSRSQAEEAQTMLVALLKKHPGYLGALPVLADSEMLQGSLQAAVGDTDSAAAHWHAALRTLDRTDPSADPALAFMSPKAVALCLLGETGKAAPILARLVEAGYREPEFSQSIDSTACSPRNRRTEIAVSRTAAHATH